MNGVDCNHFLPTRLCSPARCLLLSFNTIRRSKQAVFYNISFLFHYSLTYLTCEHDHSESKSSKSNNGLTMDSLEAKRLIRRLDVFMAKKYKFYSTLFIWLVFGRKDSRRTHTHSDCPESSLLLCEVFGSFVAQDDRFQLSCATSVAISEFVSSEMISFTLDPWRAASNLTIQTDFSAILATTDMGIGPYYVYYTREARRTVRSLPRTSTTPHDY